METRKVAYGLMMIVGATELFEQRVEVGETRVLGLDF